jgi:hypothetical protein
MCIMLEETTSVKTVKLDASKMETVYHGLIECVRVDGSTGSGCSIHGDTLPELLADAFRTGLYYMAIGHRVQVKHLTLCCRACNGSGTIPTRKQFKNKCCPECKGVGELQTFDPIELKIPEGTYLAHEVVMPSFTAPVVTEIDVPCSTCGEPSVKYVRVRQHGVKNVCLSCAEALERDGRLES